MHLMSADEMAVLVPEELPGGAHFYIYVSGLVEIACAVAILIRKYDFYAALTLAGLMLLYILLVHVPAALIEPINLTNILKDTALAGAALFYAGTRKK